MTGAPENISQRTLWPYFWALLIFTSLVVGALTYNNYRQFRDNYYTSLLTDAEKRIEVLEEFLRNEMVETYQDLEYFRSNPVNSFYINDELAPFDRMVFEKTLSKYGDIKESYRQIRLLDDEGREKLKIRYLGDSIRVNDLLQDKSDRYYYQGLKLTQSNEIYFSRFDLNMEEGRVEYPLSPVIRIGSPVYFQGERQGYILLSYKGSRILDYFDVIENDELFDAYLIDALGNWIKAPDYVEPYDYVIDPQNANSLSKDRPELWKLINRTDTSRVVSPRDLIVFEQLELLEYFGKDVRSEKTSTHWTLLVQADAGRVEEVLSARSFRTSRNALILMGLFGLILFGVFREMERQGVTISEINSTLVSRNEELVHNRAELQKAMTIAEEASAAKGQFLATMSHEIRTPMNAVIGMADLLEETHLSSDQRHFVETIQVSGSALLTVINDILDYSKIESGSMELDVHSFRLDKVIEDVMSILRNTVNSKGLDLYYSPKGHVPSLVRGDGNRIRQILLNLANNAVKFTDRGFVAIEVSYHEGREGGNYRLSVVDTGIGIPPEKQSRLFKSFSQVDSSVTRRYGGTGLGLVICKRLAELMGGSIGVESEQGKGSAFWVDIQLEVAEVQPEVKLSQNEVHMALYTDTDTEAFYIQQCLNVHGHQALRIYDSDLEHWPTKQKELTLLVLTEKKEVIEHLKDRATSLSGKYRAFLFSRSHSPLLEGPQSSKLAVHGKPWKYSTFLSSLRMEEVVKKKRVTDEVIAQDISVLVAEDNPVNRELLKFQLTKVGINADWAEDGIQAIEKAISQEYELILMDINMPGKDGLEATIEIKEYYGDQAPIIIALTANAMKEDRDRFLAAGMDDYLSKPFHQNDLIARIQKWTKFKVNTG
ncbi:response regulator [Cryomorphaceae bacterium]|nr:response regulator [Cryomorphaceae bacterium]